MCIRFSQILSHDVGRVIEIRSVVLETPAHADLAQFLNDETKKALADANINRALLGRAQDLMNGIK
jgi:hypothetical protein